MGNKLKLITLVCAISIVALIILAKNKKKDSNDSESSLLYVSPERRTIENKQLISGRLASKKEVNIKSELAGIIDDLYVVVGDRVKKGQAIAKIKILPDPKSTQDAQRQLEIAKINYERIKANFIRNQLLYEKDVIAKHEFEISSQEYNTSKSELNAAQNYLRIVKQGFSNKSDFVSNVIYSTIDGIVLDISVKIGTSIQNRNNFSEGTTIATVADDNEFVFKGQVNEKDLKYIDIGKELDIRISALKSDSFKAHISRISPKGIDVNGITRFDIEAILEVNPVDLYKVKTGFTATAEYLVERVEKVLALEEKYVQFKEDTSFVYVKKGEEGRERIFLQLGISDGKYIEIKSGLKREDMIYKEEIMTELEN